MEELSVKVQTIVRTIVLILALLNQVLTCLGKNPLNIAESDVYQIVSLAVTVGATIWAWWKNNSFTQAALKGDAIMEELKKNESSTE